MRRAAVKLWFWLLDYVAAILWQLQAVGRRRFPQIPRAQRGRHVVVIPGVYEPLTFMGALIGDVRRAGFVVHGLSVLGYNTGKIPRAASDVAAYIRDRDIRDVTILAHSKGGLIGKYVLALLDDDRRVSRMITVATPFSGSPLARLLPVRSVRDFLPSAEVIVQLNGLPDVNRRIVSIYSAFDPHIPGGSFLPGAENIQVGAMGHFRILRSPEVRQAVLRSLAADPPAPSTASETGASA
jgi:pimeloyl-ACP methyl ester carboxylesterase